MKLATIQLETLTCPSCLQKIEAVLKQTKGVVVNESKVLFNASKVKVKFDSEVVSIEEIEKSIDRLGYHVLSSKVKAA